ncbi:MAG: restriction endonuclease subunit S [Nanoarchaeota archaeon]|nr:restriction endonuclease subunit S [Nanoarchaeota archaeon]
MQRKTKLKQTEIGEIPEDWEIKRIEEVVNIDMGQSPPGDSYNGHREGMRFLQGVRTFGDKYPFFDTYTTQVTKKAKAGSVLLSVRAPVGEVNITKEDMCVGRGLASLNMKNGNNEFLYYLLKKFSSLIRGRETGSVFGSINSEQIKSLSLPFPSISEQKSIAKILSDLDTKIELNNKVNKNLESIGMVLFKKWFVDERKKEWETKKLGDYVNVIKGCSYRSEDLQESDSALVTLKSVNRGGGLNQEGYKEFVGEYREEQLLQDGDIIVAQTDLTQKAEVIGTPAIVNLIDGYNNLIASLDLQIIRPKKQLTKSFVYYLLRSKRFHDHALSYTNGTTVLHLSKNAVPEFEFLVPDQDTLKKFDLIAKNLLLRIKANNIEIDRLSKIRDLLLPKLMSGEIRIK